MTKEYLILDRIMVSVMLTRVFQRSFSRTTLQRAIQQQIIQEDGNIAREIVYSMPIDVLCRESTDETRNQYSSCRR